MYPTAGTVVCLEKNNSEVLKDETPIKTPTIDRAWRYLTLSVTHVANNALGYSFSPKSAR